MENINKFSEIKTIIKFITNARKRLLIGAISGTIIAYLVVIVTPIKYEATTIIDLIPFKIDSSMPIMESTADFLEVIKIDQGEKLLEGINLNSRLKYIRAINDITQYKSPKFIKIKIIENSKTEAKNSIDLLSEAIIKEYKARAQQRIENVINVMHDESIINSKISNSKVEPKKHTDSVKLYMKIMNPYIIRKEVNEISLKKYLLKYLLIGMIFGMLTVAGIEITMNKLKGE